MKNFKFLRVIALIILALNLNSCLSTLASVHNTYLLDTTESEYINEQMYSLRTIQLTDEQEASVREIFGETYAELKENAHKEKIKEIKNKTSLNNLVYINYKKQMRVEKILTEEQIKSTRKNGFGQDGEALANIEERLDKQGYELNI